jgi:predicted Fe-Mo cluster-binding NifX family protein
MIRMAIPVRDDCVSPAFDFARRLLLVELENAREAKRSAIALPPESAPLRAERLRALGVDILICGAISRDLAGWTTRGGIEILSYVSGPIDEVVQAYAAGRLGEPRFVLPGCWPGARKGFRRCRRRRHGGR